MTFDLNLLFSIVIAALIFYVVVWAIDWVGVEAPFNKVLKVLIAIAVVLYLVGILTGHAPGVHFK
jgi:uncharacterized membrane protein